MPFDYDYDEEKHARRLRRLLIAFPVVLLFVWVVYFWAEIIDVLTIPWIVVALFLGFDPPPIPPNLLWSIYKLAFVLIFGFGASLAIWLYLFASQAWLPVSTPREIYQTAEHFLLFVRRKYGPAVFVKDGQLVQATPEELRRHRAGVLVIDYNSAVALENVVYGPGKTRLWRALFPRRRPAARYRGTRIAGPGITFTGASERIYGAGDVKGMKSIDEVSGVADLRILFRMNEKWLSKEPPPSGPRISCYSRDGIELKTAVWALFTVGQKPDIVRVTYKGDRRPENLVVVSLELTPENLIQVKDIGERDELEEEDYQEIHQAAAGLRIQDDTLIYQYPDPSLPTTQPDFDPERVFAAIYATARTPDKEVIPWPYLPSHVALDMFREIMSRTNYDDLYTLDEKGRPRIGEVQKKLRLRMRNNGLLSYQLIQHCYRTSLVKGVNYRPEDLRMTLVRPFTNPKILRQRGIKVIASGFGDLDPVSKEVYEKRLDNWRATWETDTAIARAGYALEAMRIHNRARVQAQKELMYSISQIFEKDGYSDEILAIRLFQALEKIASDPQTNKLLPGDTINLLRTMHDWLLPAANVTPLPPPVQ